MIDVRATLWLIASHLGYVAGWAASSPRCDTVWLSGVLYFAAGSATSAAVEAGDEDGGAVPVG